MSWLDAPHPLRQCNNCQYWFRDGPKGADKDGIATAPCSVKQRPNPSGGDPIIEFVPKRGSDFCEKWSSMNGAIKS